MRGFLRSPVGCFDVLSMPRARLETPICDWGNIYLHMTRGQAQKPTLYRSGILSASARIGSVGIGADHKSVSMVHLLLNGPQSLRHLARLAVRQPERGLAVVHACI